MDETHGTRRRVSVRHLPSPASAPYATSKADMAVFPKHLANRVAGRGVRINCATRAGVLAQRMECRMPEGAKRQAVASVQFGRMGHRRPWWRRRRCTSHRMRRPRSRASPST
jgi:NAD(P)-dependent dehydrogenase (short-subunit alcohol dehydrogenase family)